MAVPLLDRLQEKVQAASSELVSLRKERERLQGEVGLMQEESRRARRILREYQELLAERKNLRKDLNVFTISFQN
jgi:FtsZ-binding cell division protein ZapB